MTICRQLLALTFIAILASVHPRLAVALGDTAVNAGPCSIAAGNDAKNNTVTCNFGLTPAQLKELTQAAVAGATEPLLDRIESVGKRLGVTQEAAKTLLRIVGQQDIPDEKLAEVLTSVAADYKRLKTQAAALNPDNPIAQGLVAQANAAIEAGRLDQAHQLLHQATQAQLAAAQEARKLLEQAQAAEDAQMLGAAHSTAAEADVALTERQYQQAAGLFGQAAGYTPPGSPAVIAGYLERQADALYRQGDERGDNPALESSILTWRRALQFRPRDRFPLDWARTQTNLGTALLKLGERASGTGRLEEAVSAYRAALEERTRDRVPLGWAMTQTNLGAALLRLGERESGTARLEEAVAAFRAALEEWTRDRVPLDWAMTQNNLGIALWTLGGRESGTGRLEEAVSAYRAALEEWTRDRVPLDWAMTQNNLGLALWTLGGRESGTGRLEEAEAAYRAALEERTRDRVPLDWAM
ncbi:MAG TPA: tetratricopeptide repeat protein, partial [Rhodopila sp.]